MQKFIQSVKGFFIDLSLTPGCRNVLEELLYIVSHLPNNHWKRVAKISKSCSNGGQIEFTSSHAHSLGAWISDHHKYGNQTKNFESPQCQQFNLLLNQFETYVHSSIINFAQQSFRQHITRISLQPGALRSLPGTVPQRAHRDFSHRIYATKYPGQVFIGFMPVSEDGSFLQVWIAPGLAKLVFIPYGSFLVLPGNTIHAGWMCTSLVHHNFRLHFYILAHNDSDGRSRHESYVFENMNTYCDEELPSSPPLYSTYLNALSDCSNFLGL
jgi:hypothetical protein